MKIDRVYSVVYNTQFLNSSCKILKIDETQSDKKIDKVRKDAEFEGKWMWIVAYHKYVAKNYTNITD